MAPLLGEQAEEGSEPQSSPMLQIQCSGSPYEIGHQHGSLAKLQVTRSIAFYTAMFQETSQMTWDVVREVALSYEPDLKGKWPQYLDEMQGLADGAGVDICDIIACNVRTEIAYGLSNDGCTALSWQTDEASYLAQNWDWQEAQKENLIILTIEQGGGIPTIQMVTEAGLIGKIGLNSAGVGVCLNALRVKGMDPSRLPCHLGLRMVLESRSRDEAVARLEEVGIASACHMLIADATGGIGLEWSSTDVQKCEMNSKKQIFHGNHYLLPHPVSSWDERWIADSTRRVARIEQLADQVQGTPTPEKLFEIFKDEMHYPGAICRAQKSGSHAASLFNIVMDLTNKTANVTLGRPTEPEGFVRLQL